MPDAQGCVEVDKIPLGCALIRREELESMVGRYSELEYRDGVDEVCALFQLILENKALYSEDHSFCIRWKAAGNAIHMYLGEGSPVDHHGSHCYKGDLGAFGLRLA